MILKEQKWLRPLSTGIRGFLILTAIFFLGEWIAGYLPIPVPGAVIGMLIVFLMLQFRLLPLQWVDSATTWLLAFLGLFYVPYGVGIVGSGQLIGQWGGQIIMVMVVTIISVFFITGRIFQALIRTKNTTDE